MIGLASTTYQQGYGSSNEVNSDWQYQQWTDSFTAQQQQGTVTNLYDGNVSNEEQHYESIPDLRSYPTTHASGLYGTGYARSAVDSRGIEHTEQQARQSHNVAFNHFHPDAHSTTPTEANSATSNTTYHQTTVISNPYPGIEPVDQRQTATYHQEHIQHLPHQYNAMSSYPSEAIGSTIGNHTSSNLADRNSASLSPPSSVLSSMSTTFRVNITERGTYPRTEQLGPNVDLSPGRSDAVGNDTESTNVGAQDIPTRSVVQPSMVSPKRKRRKNTSNPDIAVSSSALSREEAQLDAENGEDGFSVGVDGLGDVGRPGKGVGGLRT
ncbi:hypothetical protein APHAL10511_006874 [Amanita phalloides]|nr:hypothetical protein APHAL10511_006874 [Amanita phalloides]